MPEKECKYQEGVYKVQTFRTTHDDLKVLVRIYYLNSPLKMRVQAQACTLTHISQSRRGIK
jgi:hypothetical protein